MNPLSSQRYELGSSWLHHLDPRVKVVTTILLIVGVVVTPDYAWVTYPLLWTLVGSLAAMSRFSVWRLGRLAGLALPFTVAAATLLVTTPGHPVLRVASLIVTDTGLARFLGIVLKSWLSMQIALWLTWTTPPAALLLGLRGLGVSETLVAIISLMQRYLLTLKDEAERLLRARAARSGVREGIKPGGSLFWRARVAGGMVGNLFLRSYERSERVYAAMLARGYNGHFHYQNLPPLNWQDVGAGAVPVIVIMIIQIVVRL
ncbi:MAG: cobalt ECF transporter T component CbiQ [Anaerolineae bacterium]